MASTFKIFLYRHGETEYMLEEKIGGDSSLTAKGRAYAQQLTQLIMPRIPTHHTSSRTSRRVPVSVLTSTLQRTIQTAAHLPFKQQRVKALDEINAGICEHMTYEEVAQRYPDVHAARSKDKLGYRYPDGESYLDLVSRLWPVVHALEQRQGHVILVAHQAVLRVLVGLLLRKPLQDMPTMSIPLHTVMELTPTTGGGFDMKCFKAAMTETTPAPAASLLPPAPSSAPLLLASASSSAPMGVSLADSRHLPVLSMKRGSSCGLAAAGGSEGGWGPTHTGGLMPAACSA